MHEWSYSIIYPNTSGDFCKNDLCEKFRKMCSNYTFIIIESSNNFFSIIDAVRNLIVKKVDPIVAIQDHREVTSSVYYPSSIEASGALRKHHEFATGLRTALDEYNIAILELYGIDVKSSVKLKKQLLSALTNQLVIAVVDNIKNL